MYIPNVSSPEIVLGTCANQSSGFQHALHHAGKTIQDLLFRRHLTSPQMTFSFTLIYLWTLAALKLSQLFLYMRVFAIHIKNWIFAGITIVIVWAVVFTFVFIFLCNPIQQQWSLERIGHCMDQIFVLKALIATNVLTDLFVFALPIRSVWRLQMRKTEKLAVLSCFALGAA